MVLKTRSMTPGRMRMAATTMTRTKLTMLRQTQKRTVFGLGPGFFLLGGCRQFPDARVVYGRTRAWVVRGHR
jgi:hypothetical protein